MYIYEKYDYSLFESRFRDYNRLNNFPRGLRMLFDSLENLAKDLGEPIELDVVGICCDYTESTVEQALKETMTYSLDELRDETFVIMVDEDEDDPESTIIYQNY